MAVQNSELLRRLCLLATAGAHNRGLATPTQFIPHLLTLQNSLLSVRLSAVVEGLVPLIRACSQELTWRLSFHSNMLFGEYNIDYEALNNCQAGGRGGAGGSVPCRKVVPYQRLVLERIVPFHSVWLL